MADKRWKQFERRVAKDFSSTRTSLSGGNGKVTRSDTHHPTLFLECKHNQESAVWNLYEKTRDLAHKEDKLPVLCLGKVHRKGYLIVVHSEIAADVLPEFLKCFQTGDSPVPIRTRSLSAPAPTKPWKRRKKKADDSV